MYTAAITTRKDEVFGTQTDYAGLYAHCARPNTPKKSKKSSNSA
jgi:hypothetical protein